MRRSTKFILLALLSYGCLPLNGRAANYVFTNIADNTTPGPVGTLNPFSDPAIHGGVVVFGASYDSGAQRGVFVGSGGPLTTVVKTGDAAPVGTFNNVGAPTISSAGVTFAGRYENADGTIKEEGIFVKNGDTRTTIAETGVIGPFGVFTHINDPVSSGNNVAFVASATAGAGIYISKGGILSAIAQIGDLGPTGTPFNGLGRPAISGDKVAFHGTYPGGNGVFVGDGGPLTTIVKTGDPAPIGTFDGGDYPDVSNGTVAFRASYGPISGPFQGGVLTAGGLVPSIVALDGDPAPIGTFDLVSNPSISGQTIAFQAVYGGFTYGGIFVFRDGTISSFIKSGDALFGSTVTGAGIEAKSLDHDGSGRIAFYYGLADGRYGIAVATPVPEPSGLVLLVVGSLFVHGRRRVLLR
jgi:hypothetical protein